MDVDVVRTTRRLMEEAERAARAAIDDREEESVDVPRCPLILRIEVTNRCNANCVFCAYQHQKRPHATLAWETFKQAVDEFTALGGTAVNLSPVVGEALLDPGLEEKAGYIARFPQYARIELFTNGVLLTGTRFERLVAAGVNDFHIALSGFSAEEYRRVYRTDRYARVVENLAAIAASPARRGVRVTVHARTDALWPGFEPDYLRLRRLDAFPILFEPHVVSWHGVIAEASLPGYMFLVAGPREQRRPCLLLWGGQTVLADGRMTLCGCSDVDGEGLPLGRIGSVALDAHLKDGRWKAWRDGFLAGTPPDFCRGCDSYRPRAGHRADPVDRKVLATAPSSP